MKSYKLVFFLILFSFSFLILNAQTKLPPDMIFVKGGTFIMGNDKGDTDERPAHTVTVSDFYISKYEITVAQYQQFCKEANYSFPNMPSKAWYEEHNQVGKWQWKQDHPITNISWLDAMAFCKWLTSKTGVKYTLPTEAQWEFAAKGGTKSRNTRYSGSSNINEVAWYDETTHEKGTRPVGKLKPNELGIYDMSGNVWEYCLDRYAPYTKGVFKDPTGPTRGAFYVIRGGGWYYSEDMCTVTMRDGPKPIETNFNFGFRVVKYVK